MGTKHKKMSVQELRVAVSSETPDAMRRGFAAAGPHPNILPHHPVELIQKNAEKKDRAVRLNTASAVYGSAFTQRLQLEQTLLNQPRRLPGLPQSNIALDCLLGRDDDMPEPYFTNPNDSENIPRATLLEQMEARFLKQ